MTVMLFIFCEIKQNKTFQNQTLHIFYLCRKRTDFYQNPITLVFKFL
jgi:hypothetical protein